MLFRVVLSPLSKDDVKVLWEMTSHFAIVNAHFHQVGLLFQTWLLKVHRKDHYKIYDLVIFLR